MAQNYCKQDPIQQFARLSPPGFLDKYFGKIPRFKKIKREQDFVGKSKILARNPRVLHWYWCCLGVDAITCDALKDAQMTSWMGTAKAPSFKIIGVANWNRISQHTLISKWILSTDENTNTAPFEYHMRRVTFDHETGIAITLK